MKRRNLRKAKRGLVVLLCVVMLLSNMGGFSLSAFADGNTEAQQGEVLTEMDLSGGAEDVIGGETGAGEGEDALPSSEEGTAGETGTAGQTAGDGTSETTGTEGQTDAGQTGTADPAGENTLDDESDIPGAVPKTVTIENEPLFLAPASLDEYYDVTEFLYAHEILVDNKPYDHKTKLSPSKKFFLSINFVLYLSNMQEHGLYYKYKFPEHIKFDDIGSEDAPLDLEDSLGTVIGGYFIKDDTVYFSFPGYYDAVSAYFKLEASWSGVENKANIDVIWPDEEEPILFDLSQINISKKLSTMEDQPDGSRAGEFVVTVSPKEDNMALNDITFHDKMSSTRVHIIKDYYKAESPANAQGVRIKVYGADGGVTETLYYDFDSVAEETDEGNKFEMTITGLNIPAGGHLEVTYGVGISFDDVIRMEAKDIEAYVSNNADASYPIYDDQGNKITDVESTISWYTYVYPRGQWMKKEKGTAQYEPGDPDVIVPYTISVNRRRAYSLGGSIVRDEITQYDPAGGVKYNFSSQCRPYYMWMTDTNVTGTNVDMDWVILDDDLFAQLQMELNKGTQKTAMENLLYGDANYAVLRENLAAAMNVNVSAITNEFIGSKLFTDTSNQDDFIWIMPLDNIPTTYMLHYYTDVPAMNIGNENSARMWYTEIEGAPDGGVGFVNPYRKVMEIDKENYGVYEDGNGNFFVDWHISVTVPKDSQFDHILLADNLQYQYNWNSILNDGDYTYYTDWFPAAEGMSYNEIRSMTSVREVAEWEWAWSDKIFKIEANPNKYVDAEITQIAENLKGVFGRRSGTGSSSFTLTTAKASNYMSQYSGQSSIQYDGKTFVDPYNFMFGSYWGDSIYRNGISAGKGQFLGDADFQYNGNEYHADHYRFTPRNVLYYIDYLPAKPEEYTFDIYYTTQINPRMIQDLPKYCETHDMATMTNKVTAYQGIEGSTRGVYRFETDYDIAKAEASYYIAKKDIEVALDKTIAEYNKENKTIKYTVEIDPKNNVVLQRDHFVLEDIINYSGLKYQPRTFVLTDENGKVIWSTDNANPVDASYSGHADKIAHTIDNKDHGSSNFSLDFNNDTGLFENTDGKLMKMYLSYTVDVSGWKVTETLSNAATLFKISDIPNTTEKLKTVLGNDTCEITADEALVKRITDTATAENKYRMTYEAIINTQSADAVELHDLKPGDKFVVKDTLSKNLYLQLDTLKIEYLDFNDKYQTLPEENYKVEFYDSDHELYVTFIAPDMTPMPKCYKLSYVAAVERRNDMQHTVNTIEVLNSAINEVVVAEDVQTKSHDAGADATKLRITLKKFDANDTSINLSAKFKLSVYDTKTKSWKQILRNDATGGYFTTSDTTGKIEIKNELVSQSKTPAIEDKKWYKLEEVEAPKHYALDPTPIYYYTTLKGESPDDSTRPSDIKKDNYRVITIGNDENPTFYIGNSKLSFNLRKVDDSDNTILLKGAEFKLYSDANCTNLIAESEERLYGEYRFSGIDTGENNNSTYYLKETKQPDGYRLNADVYKVIVENGMITKIVSASDDTKELQYVSADKVYLYTNEGINGNLVITKKITAYYTDDLNGVKNYDIFEFLLTLTDENGQVYKDGAGDDVAFEYIKTAANGNRSTGTIKSGETFTLKHGEKLQIINIPEKSLYEVTETEKFEYTASVTVTDKNGTDAKSEKVGLTASGSIEAKNTDTLDFNNTMKSTLYLYKMVEAPVRFSSLDGMTFTIKQYYNPGETYCIAHWDKDLKEFVADYLYDGIVLKNIVKGDFNGIELDNFPGNIAIQIEETNADLPNFKRTMKASNYDTFSSTKYIYSNRYFMDTSGAHAGATISYYISNSYETAVDVPLSAKKTMTGRTLQDGDFTFELLKNNSVIDTATCDANGDIVFSTRKYTQETTEPEVYRIREKIPAGTYYKNGKRYKDGIYYDESIYYVTINVAADPDDNNKLKGTVTYEKDSTAVSADDVIFNNEYYAEAKVSLKGSKSLVGRRISDHEFEILYDKTVTKGGTVIESATGEHFQYAGQSGSSPTPSTSRIYKSNITYPQFLFTQDDVGKIYTYKIYENVPDAANAKPGVTYSTEYYTVTINVKADNGDGTLELETTIKDSAGNDVDADNINFVNTYSGSIKVQIKATKMLTIKTLQDQQFEFVITEYGNEIARAKNDADGNIIFDPIEYGIVGNVDGTTSTPQGMYPLGNHRYVIKEVIPDDDNKEPGISYTTKTWEVSFTPTPNADGTFSIGFLSNLTEDTTASTDTLKVLKVKESGGASFVNSYHAYGSFTLPATKTLNGRAENQGEFGMIANYQLFDSAGNLDYESGETIYASTAGDGTWYTWYSNSGALEFEFDEYYIGYSYKLIFREFTPADSTAFGFPYDIPGVTFSDEVYTVTGTVVDNGDGTLDVTPTITNKAGQVVQGLDFVNEYKAEGTLKLKASKLLKGRTLENGQFSFGVYDNGTLLTTGTSDADGNVVFDDITFEVSGNKDDSGDHTLIVKEIKPSVIPGGYVYDSTEYSIGVNVVDNGDATLTITVSSGANSNDGGITYEVPNASGENASFINHYSASGTFAWSGTKNLTGRTLDNGEFTFTAVEYKLDASNNPVATGRTFTGTNDDKGVITFADMTFGKDDSKDDCGTYRYEITEDVPATKLGGVTYDTKSYTLDLRVSDAGDGTLTCTNLAPLLPITFNNTYDATGKLIFTVAKKVVTDGGRLYNDRNSAGQPNGNTFTATVYELVDDGAGGKNEVQAAQTVIDPNSSNTCEIEYHIADLGVHQYKIVENAGNAGGYTYDTTEYEVTVKVVDGRGGILYFYVQEGLVDDVDPANAGVTSFTTGEATYDKAGFTNVYTASGEAILQLNKRVLNMQFSVGNRMIKKDMFTFILSEYSDAAGDYVEVSRAKTAEGGLVTFNALPYTMSSLGTHIYKMSESKDAQSPDIIYSAGDLYAVVTVTDNGNGTLAADIKYTRESDINVLKAGTFAATNDTAVNNTTTVVGIRKVDTAGKAVVGADLEILDAAGNKVWSITSFDGEMTVYGLSRYQTYCLRETKAPDGYELADDIYFKLDYNSKIYMVKNGTETWMEKLVMVDEKTSEKPRSPKTGEHDMWWMMLLFLGASVAGISALAFKVKREEK